jgi:NCAIR mutase (PurE)-related protein
VTRDQLERLLGEVAAGWPCPASTRPVCGNFPTEQLPFAQLEPSSQPAAGTSISHFLRGKTVEQVGAIAERLVAASGGFLGTRATPEQAAALEARFPELQWNPLGRTVYLPSPAVVSSPGTGDLLTSGGTSDLPVAEEAAATRPAFGLCVGRLTDIGVAGIHRLLNQSRRLCPG